MNIIKLAPKSPAGSKAMALIGQPVSQWFVLKEADEVSFSSQLGPWANVYPDVSNGKQFARWVHLNNDKYFEVL